MALTRLYTAVATDTIKADHWNNEFGNIYQNGTDVSFPLTANISIAGFTITLDAAAVTTLISPASSGFQLTVGSKSGTPAVNGSLFSIQDISFNDNNTAASGTAALWTGFTVRTPTLTATNAGVTTTDASTFYVEAVPIAGTNITITNNHAAYFGGNIGVTGVLRTSKGSNIASASAIAVTTPFADVTGTTNISSISTVYPAGTILRLRFTGTGLNLVYNATSFISPWGRDYRTVANEIIEFISLGSGNYVFYSINGPSTRIGATIEGNVASAPDGYLVEDGSAVSRTTYSGLFAEIGTTFGTGDGSTTFNIPDTRGRVVINNDGAANIITSASSGGANADTLGGVGGGQTVALTAAMNPSHTHTFTRSTSGGLAAFAFPGGTGSSASTASRGSGTAHSNTQPWIAKYKYIRF